MPVVPAAYMGAQEAAGPSAPRDSASFDPDKEMTDMTAEECYHKELRDVLWTIVSLKLEDMRLATSQMRTAWRSYLRNTKIVDVMLQNKDRTVRALKVTCLFFTLHYSLVTRAILVSTRTVVRYLNSVTGAPQGLPWKNKNIYVN